jgi:acyl-CoA thioesterase YciA
MLTARLDASWLLTHQRNPRFRLRDLPASVRQAGTHPGTMPVADAAHRSWPNLARWIHSEPAGQHGDLRNQVDFRCLRVVFHEGNSMSDKPPEVPGGPHLRTVAMPRDSNASGDVFGGWTVSQMDLAGGGFAAERAQGRVATVSIDSMIFLRPVAVGDEVSCYCTIVDEGETSLTVKIETWARTRASRDSEKVTEGKFKFVAIDKAGKPRPLPKA